MRNNEQLWVSFSQFLTLLTLSPFCHMRIHHLLIDLGGVLYQIDIPRTMARYDALRAPDAPPLRYSSTLQQAWFTRLDQGEIDIDAFAAGLRGEFGLQAELATIRAIWRDLLIGVFPGRVEQVQRLAERYQLALLSNTSRYHYDHYREACQPMFACMQHLFLSFEMGLSKPDTAIYQQALAQAGWSAETTLFLDDSRRNLDTAAALGLQTAWIETPAHFDRWVEQLLA